MLTTVVFFSLLSMVFVILLSYAEARDTLSQEVTSQDAIKRCNTEKDCLEVSKLKYENSAIFRLTPFIIPITIAVAGIYFGYAADRRLKAEEARANQIAALTEPRICAYADAFKHLRRTALYFPSVEDASVESPRHALTKDDCVKVGQDLSSWYFGAGRECL